MVHRQPEVVVRYFGQWVPNAVQSAAHRAVREATYVGIVGGARSGKTVWLINEIIDFALRHPGITMLLSRYTDDATQTILRPIFYDVASQFPKEILGEWVAGEQRQHFANGSSVYIKGLKSGDDRNKYSKFDGLSLGLVAISQAEELPKDVWDRLKTRLSQQVPERRILFELNPTYADHFLRKEFEPEKGTPPSDHVLLHASVWDNSANLPPGYIEDLERQYFKGHPLRQRLLEGKWGLEAKGTPIIGPNLMNPDLHVQEVQFDSNWPLLLSYDPGMLHPCLTWAQLDGDNQLRVLDCMLGSEIDADSFFFAAFARQNETIGRVKEVRACADKASEQRHGSSTRTEWDIFREHLRPWNVTPLTGIVASKQFLIQRLAARFTRLVRGRPAIIFHPRAEYLIEAMMGGWVWRAPTDLRPTPNTPLDNYYAHGADTLLYHEMHWGPGIRQIEKVSAYDDDVRQRPPRRRATASGY